MTRDSGESRVLVSGVTVNGQLCGDACLRVQTPDRVDVTYDPQQGYPEKKRWSDRAYNIVFEDPHLIVVNKAAHVLTVATSKSERNTLENRLSHYLRQTSRQRRALVAHRLVSSLEDPTADPWPALASARQSGLSRGGSAGAARGSRAIGSARTAPAANSARNSGLGSQARNLERLT